MIDLTLMYLIWIFIVIIVVILFVLEDEIFVRFEYLIIFVI
jgi:hypothetical protein